MTYEIIYGQGALAQPLAVASELDDPQKLLDAYEEAMDRLASDPVAHGRRGRELTRFPDGRVTRLQEFDFHCDVPPPSAYFWIFSFL